MRTWNEVNFIWKKSYHLCILTLPSQTCEEQASKLYILSLERSKYTVKRENTPPARQKTNPAQLILQEFPEMSKSNVESCVIYQ